MSLWGYKPKHKPANWTQAFPGQVRRPAVRSKPQRYVRQKRIAPRTKAYQASSARYNREAAALVAQAQQAGGKCMVVVTIPEMRGQDATISQVHHIFGRGHGGRGPLLLDKRLWFLCSAAGHAWIDANRDQARVFGWLCPKGQYNTPVPASAKVVRNQWGGVEVVV